jgi:hemoglobin
MTEATDHAAAARDTKRAQADAMGIDATFIDRLVEGFYRRVRTDTVLGPVFAERIGDWGPHLARMKHFWAVILRGEGRFNGSPMKLHAAIPVIERNEFLRWLLLFDDTLTDMGTGPAARTHISARAWSIADSLLTGIRIQRDGRTDTPAMKGLSHV